MTMIKDILGKVDYLTKKIFIELYVKVNKNWRSNDKELKRFGYNQK